MVSPWWLIQFYESPLTSAVNEYDFSELSPSPIGLNQFGKSHHNSSSCTLISQNLSEFELHLRAVLDGCRSFSSVRRCWPPRQPPHIGSDFQHRTRCWRQVVDNSPDNEQAPGQRQTLTAEAETQVLPVRHYSFEPMPARELLPADSAWAWLKAREKMSTAPEFGPDQIKCRRLMISISA